MSTEKIELYTHTLIEKKNKEKAKRMRFSPSSLLSTELTMTCDTDYRSIITIIYLCRNTLSLGENTLDKYFEWMALWKWKWCYHTTHKWYNNCIKTHPTKKYNLLHYWLMSWFQKPCENRNLMYGYNSICRGSSF